MFVIYHARSKAQLRVYEYIILFLEVFQFLYGTHVYQVFGVRINSYLSESITSFEYEDSMLRYSKPYMHFFLFYQPVQQFYESVYVQY